MKSVVACFLALAAVTSAYSQQMNIDKLLMITMVVGDMDKSKEFYTSVLGLKATKDYSQGGQRWVALEIPGGGASLNLATVTGNLKPGMETLYFTTPDAEAAWKAVKAKGLRPARELSRESWAGSPWAAWFSLADPDGNQVLVVQMK